MKVFTNRNLALVLGGLLICFLVFHVYYPKSSTLVDLEKTSFGEPPVPFISFKSNLNSSAIIFSLNYSPDDSLLVATNGDNTISVFDLCQRKKVCLLTKHGDQVYDGCFNSDGTLFISGSWDGEAIIWNAKTWESLIARSGIAPTGIVALDIHPQRPIVAIGQGDSSGLVFFYSYSAHSFELLENQPFHQRGIFDLKYSKTGRFFASASVDSSCSVWDTELRRIHFVIDHSAYVQSVSFSQNEEMLVCGTSDGVVTIHDMKTKQQIDSFTLGSSGVNCVVFSSDDAYVFIGLGDGGITPGELAIWDVQDQKLLARFEAHKTSIESMTLSHSGMELAAGTADGVIYCWRVNDLLRR